jgi:hypothetical protein
MCSIINAMFAADYTVQSVFCLLARFLYNPLNNPDDNMEGVNKLEQV